MKLVSAGVSGVKRFADAEPMMDLVGTPIAIVGPNEVGKTTWLKALTYINGDEPDFASNDFTRDGDQKIRIEAIFNLDDSDVQAIADVGGVGRPRQMKVVVREDNELRCDLIPPITRDFKLRLKTRATADKVVSTLLSLSDLPEDIEETVKRVDELLRSDDRYDDEDIELLRSAAEMFQPQAEPGHLKPLRKLGVELGPLADTESGNPDRRAATILLKRRPTFLLFNEDRRQLDSTFNVNADSPTTATLSLLQIAGLDLGQLQQAISAQDAARIAELRSSANDTLLEIFESRWQQANITVEISIDGDLLHIFIRNASRKLIPIADRSDGLKQFVALVAFIEQRAPGREVILLIDEAEMHLHYDAQADLVQMLTHQQVAQKVIYTTHSAGCLPGDLGTGVRAIAPTGDPAVAPKDWEHSKVVNAFWYGSQGAGTSALLMAMGARSFVFAATRRAVIGEGISDAMLFPTLFKEALGTETLEFQVVFGISTTSPRDIDELDTSAARVVYVVDADPGGLQNRQKLLDSGIPSRRILVLGVDKEIAEADDLSHLPPLALEDLVAADLYLEAVNHELLNHGHQMTAADLPNIGRKKAIKDWCKARGLSTPSERTVSQLMLEIVGRRRQQDEKGGLLDPSRKTLVRALHRRVLRHLA
jgi:predicted ATP-dependent endonuclease of OLD family